MIRHSLLSLVAISATFVSLPSAEAANGFAHGFEHLPYFSGFYQPYGIRYSTSVRTPPYFAVNPPVYYGARHARPYGISPFASLPQVEAGSGYHSRHLADFVVPPAPICGNPFCAPVEELPGPRGVEPLDSEPLKIEPTEAVETGDEPLASQSGPVRTNPLAIAKLAVGRSPLQ
ncbi:hypothetical protein [Candidatus Laterigemmans baculatus]|uniref:hypothetical protein n=1 Tax=Candidatus Laterigemmans baculatus TaxID=2770505 RepID=UPI0013D96332|nr:hypothetical protein [Candidatus Laterigemmans baculatus]